VPAGNILLQMAGWGSLVASALHLACIVGGPEWYRFLGAGERMARAAERGSWHPAIVAIVIATILAAWGAYAFSAAGTLPRLPLIRTALVLISAVLLLRAGAYFIRASWRPDLSDSFMLWSSLIVLALGLCFALGTWRSWDTLSERLA
jgi:hypothetical protein